MSVPVTIPLINPNEPEALLVSLDITEGQKIDKDDLICTLETTKSTHEVFSESSGYIIGIRFQEGLTVRAGDVLCYIAGSPDWQPEKEADVQTTGETGMPEGLRMTQPALKLAQEQKFDLTQLPKNQLITAAIIRAKLEESGSGSGSLSISQFDPTAILIYGAGGHGKALLDLLRILKIYRVIGFVDDGVPPGHEIMGCPVLGGNSVLLELHQQGVRLAVNAVGGIGNVAIRLKVFEHLARAGFVCPPAVHPTAFIESSATLSPGVQVFPHAYVGSETKVGFGAIVNTGAIVSHDCYLGECVNISPGAILAGEVKVGNGALIGMGVTVNLQVQIGASARIGNGATVKTNVPENGIVGAGKIWPTS